MPGWQHPEETDLVRGAQAGDVEAFGKLYDHYAPSLFRFLAAHTDDTLDAEDLTEEVFIKVWKALPGYRQRGLPFTAYLFRIARNALTDHYRRSRRRGDPLPIDEALLRDEGADPAQLVVAAQERRQIRQLLAGLREDYRTVLTLRFFSGLSSQEVAQVMGRSPGAVRVLQHRALLELEKLLSAQE